MSQMLLGPMLFIHLADPWEGPGGSGTTRGGGGYPQLRARQGLYPLGRKLSVIRVERYDALFSP